jgi:hypothetical protein
LRRFDHCAGAVDHLKPAVALPQGERLTLEQTNLHGIGSMRATLACSTQASVSNRSWRRRYRPQQRHADVKVQPSRAWSGSPPTPSTSTSRTTSPPVSDHADQPPVDVVPGVLNPRR